MRPTILFPAVATSLTVVLTVGLFELGGNTPLSWICVASLFAIDIAAIAFMIGRQRVEP